MKKIIVILKLISRSQFFFKTPEKCDLVVYDETSIYDLKICLSKFSFFVLQTRLPSPVDILVSKNSKKYKIYFSYKILKKILKNYFKGNLFTVYLISLIELIDPKVVITTVDISFKFSDITKILGEKIKFIAIQNALEQDFLDWHYLYETKKMKQNLVKKLYIPNLFCMGDHDKKIWKQLNVKVNNFYPIGNLRLANFFHHIKAENNSPDKYNSDICLISEDYGIPISKSVIKENLVVSKLNEDGHFEEGLVKMQKYTIKFCLEHNMKLLIPLKRDKKYAPGFRDLEIEYFERNFEKEESDFIKRNILEKNQDDFSSYRALFNSKVAVSLRSTLLRNKLSMGGKILSCNLTKIDRYNFPVNGICKLNNCSYEEFEKRLLEIYSIAKEDYFSRIDKNWNSLDKFSNNYSTIDKCSKNYLTIDLIGEQLSQLGVNQNF